MAGKVEIPHRILVR